MSAQLAELLKRLLPSEKDKRIRQAIMTAFGSASGVARGIRNQIDIENRTRTGVLVNGSLVFNSGIEAEVSGWAWAIDYNISEGEDQTIVTVAPDENYVRADFFHGDSDGVIHYTPGILDNDGNSIFPDIPEGHLVLTQVFRNPDGSNEIADPTDPESILDFTEDNVLPMTLSNKLVPSGARRNEDRFTFNARVKGEPAQFPDEFVILSQLPEVTRYGLISRPVIQYSGTGLKYWVSPQIYAIGTVYTAPFKKITLDDANGTHPRLDVIGWNTDSVAFYLPGTPAENPVKPIIDPETQIEGTVILVPAGATVPDGVTTELVYDENDEPNWTVSAITTGGTVNPDSTANPHQNTKAVEASNLQHNDTIIFTRDVILDITGANTFGFWLKLKNSFPSGHNLVLAFRDGPATSLFTPKTLAFDKSNLDYQFIGVDILPEELFSTDLKSINIQFQRSGGPQTNPGFFIDVVQLQGGVDQPVVVAGISHAPADDQWYASRNKAWQVFLPFPEAPVDGKQYARKDAAWAEVEGGGASPSTGLTDLDTFPVLKFDQRYRYAHQMAGPIIISLSELVTHQHGNFNVIYIQADGTNKPTFTEDFTVVWDNWNNTSGQWNRLWFEYTPSGKVITEIRDTSGDTNPGAADTTFTLTFDEDDVRSHVILGSVLLEVDDTDAEYGKKTIFYFRANGTNKPTWSAPIEANWDNYINEDGVWNRFCLEYTPEDKVTLQIINT